MNETPNAAARPQTPLIDRIADRVDLAIDILTLGQYGLEQTTTAGVTGCEGDVGHSGLREALPPARRRGCQGEYRPSILRCPRLQLDEPLTAA